MIEMLDCDCESQNEAIGRIATKVEELIGVVNILLERNNIYYEDKTGL